MTGHVPSMSLGVPSVSLGVSGCRDMMRHTRDMPGHLNRSRSLLVPSSVRYVWAADVTGEWVD